jgi:hypothetical protein
MTTASRSLATALWESALRERLAPSELHQQLGHNPKLDAGIGLGEAGEFLPDIGSIGLSFSPRSSVLGS